MAEGTSAGSPIKRAFYDLSEKDVDDAEQLAVIRSLGFGRTAGWDEVLRSRLVLLLAEAQSGKTFECQARQKAMWDAGEPAFYVELAEVARQPWAELRMPEESQRLEKWRRTESGIATIFLDSVDELKLTAASFRSALRNVAVDLAGQMSRVRVIITSRPLPVERDLFFQTFAAPIEPRRLSEDDFARMAIGEERKTRKADPVEAPEVRYVSLLPLSQPDIAALAAGRGVKDVDGFLAGLAAASMMEFMRRPQDVIEAASAWNALGGKFGTHYEQVGFDIAARLKANPERNERPLEDTRALDGAKRLALAAVATKRLTIRHSVQHDLGTETAAIDPVAILPDWTEDDRKALLERALFGYASYGRVRFHNRLAVDYLAAGRLSDLIGQGLSRKAVRRMLVVRTAQGTEVISPSMRDVAAWLAIGQPWVFELVNGLDPALLMNLGDPGSLTLDQRKAVLGAFIRRYSDGGWRGLSVPEIQSQRIADSSLSPIVLSSFDTIENPEVRQVLLDLIKHGRMTDCAPIARKVVADPDTDFYERMDALDALVALQDQALGSIAEALRTALPAGGHRFARALIYRLFARWMSVDALLGALAIVAETRATGSELSRNLPALTDRLPTESLQRLRAGLVPLLEAGLRLNPESHSVRSDRAHLAHFLGAVCAELLERGALAPSDARAVALAGELARGVRGDDEIPGRLARAIEAADLAVREAIFRESVALLRRVNPDRPADDLFFELVWRGTLRCSLGDEVWVRGLVADPQSSADLRAAALRIAIHVLPPSTDEQQAYLEGLRPLVADDERLAGVLDHHLSPATGGREMRRYAVCRARRERQEARRMDKARASWVMFWRELQTDPDTAFAPGRAQITARELWRAMGRDGVRRHSAGWDRQLIEAHFGKAVADRLRTAMLPIWRHERPPLPSQRAASERNSYFERWILALSAIAAEAESEGWADALTPDDAETALHYVPWHSSGFPPWLDALAARFPMLTEQVLGGELTWRLGQPAAGHGASIELQNVRQASPAVARLFLPRLRAWLQAGAGAANPGDEPPAAAQRLEQVLEALLAHGDRGDEALVAQMAAAALAQGASADFERVWLPALFAVDPAVGVERLEAICAAVPVGSDSEAVAWFGRLFGHLHRGNSVSLKHPAMTPDLLLRLVRLAYRHVERKNDAPHDGPRSLDMRDEAESARNALLSVILDLTGVEGWKVKQQLADDPAFAHLRDRVRALALEKAAAESDQTVMTPAEVVGLDRFQEPGPRSPGAMFAVMRDRLEDLQAHLLEDVSPREMWAGTDSERVMRRAIAAELTRTARGAYTVSQESATAEEKETDIRLLSTASAALGAIEGVIELKIGDKGYSLADLLAVVPNQLVKKYLAPHGRRAGILVITRSRKQSWTDALTGEKLDFGGVISRLRAAAAEFAESYPDELHLDVIGIDLAPRLPTERAAKTGTAPKPSAGRRKPARRNAAPARKKGSASAA